jgi:GNAT superfamily N-acetyltransferase
MRREQAGKQSESAAGGEVITPAAEKHAGIRKACSGDAVQLAGLMAELGYPTSSAEMSERLEGILGDPTYALFVFEAGGRVAGVAGVALHRFLEKNGLYARVVALVVTAGARRGGIGAQLMCACEEWSKGRGATEIGLTSGAQRAQAHEFYRRQGFAETGFRFAKDLRPSAG